MKPHWLVIPLMSVLLAGCRSCSDPVPVEIDRSGIGNESAIKAIDEIEGNLREVLMDTSLNDQHREEVKRVQQQEQERTIEMMRASPSAGLNGEEIEAMLRERVSRLKDGCDTVAFAILRNELADDAVIRGWIKDNREKWLPIRQTLTDFEKRCP